MAPQKHILKALEKALFFTFLGPRPLFARMGSLAGLFLRFRCHFTVQRSLCPVVGGIDDFFSNDNLATAEAFGSIQT